MKGMVFTEFLDFVGAEYGEDMCDDIIDAASPLPSGGAYTSVGTYDHTELVSLCVALSERTGVSTTALVRGFGVHLSARFAQSYPGFFARSPDFFDFLASVEDHIHVEVRKLYPEAELPSFLVEQRSANRLVMAYRSPRRMSALAEGLISGSARQFGVEVSVQSAAIEGCEAGGTRFVIELV